MSFKLLVTFSVQEDKVDAFVEIMQSAKSGIESAPGCEGVEVLRSTEQAGKIILAELWVSKELHDEYAEKMKASGSMDSLAAFLVAAPESEFFSMH